MEARKRFGSKTPYYVDHAGIRVEGFSSKTAALKAWEAKRNEYAARAAQCEPFIFTWQSATLVVYPTQEGWTYAITTGDMENGIKRSSCFYGTPETSQVSAIVDALGALAQYTWTREVPDDAAWFDSMVSLARIWPDEAVRERDNFLYVAQHWRAHTIAA